MVEEPIMKRISDYSTRCKCFQRIQGCSEICGWKKIGYRTQNDQQKAKITRQHPKASGDFFKDHGKGPPHDMYNDCDHFILQQIVYSQVSFGEREPYYDRLYETFLFVFKLRGSTKPESNQRIRYDTAF